MRRFRRFEQLVSALAPTDRARLCANLACSRRRARQLELELAFFTLRISDGHRYAPDPFFAGIFLISDKATNGCRSPPLGIAGHRRLLLLKLLCDLAE